MIWYLPTWTVIVIQSEKGYLLSEANGFCGIQQSKMTKISNSPLSLQ